MGFNREFVLMVAAGVLSLLIIFVSGLDHLAAGSVLVFLVVGFALFLAMARFGPDRVPLEVYLVRRIAWHRRQRRFSYLRPASPPPPPPSVKPSPAISPQAPKPAPPPLAPIQWIPSSSAAYGLATTLAVVAGAYFLLWLQHGGLWEIARTLQLLYSLLGGRP